MWIWFVAFCAVAILLWYRSALSAFDYLKKQGVPHPKVSLLFGNLKEVMLFRKTIGELYNEMYQEYSSLPYVGLYKMRRPTILLRDPKLIKDVLVTNFDSFSENDIEVKADSDPFVSHTPFFTNGLKWKTSRSQVSPSLTGKQIKLQFPIMQLVSKRLVAFLEDPVLANGGIEIKSLCEKFTMDLFASCIIGLDAKSFQSIDSDFVKASKLIFAPTWLANLKIMFQMAFPRAFETSFIPIESVNYFKNVVNETIKFRKINNVIRHDFLNTMIDAQVKLGEKEFSNDVVVGHVISFLIDGFESTSRVLSYILYQLSKEVAFQDELRTEIVTKCNLQEDGDVDYEAVQELELINYCINEAQRLHPPVIFMGKKSTKSFSLPPLTANGKPVTLPPGTSIIIPVYSLHYDPKYFPNPESYNPKRFDKDGNIEKCTFLPFGDGPRACIGKQFSFTLIKTVLVYILLNYDIRLNNKTVSPMQIKQQSVFVTITGGLWLNFTKR